jgi:hypothetical protein
LSLSTLYNVELPLKELTGKERETFLPHKESQNQLVAGESLAISFHTVAKIYSRHKTIKYKTDTLATSVLSARSRTRANRQLVPLTYFSYNSASVKSEKSAGRIRMKSVWRN